MTTWSTTGAVSAASKAVCASLGHADLAQSQGLSLYRSSVCARDVLLWGRERGGRVVGCYSADAGRWVELETLICETDHP